MRPTLTAVAIACALSAAACGTLSGRSGPGAPSYSSAPGSAQAAPQSSNSLPPGAAVNGPIASGRPLITLGR